MKVFHSFAEARGLIPGCAVALGNFDGVHLGHQALFAEASRRASARGAPTAVATFDPHPGKVLTPQLAPKLISPLWRRLELMEALGVDAVVVQRFDRAYAASSPEEFLSRDLFGLQPGDIVVGQDFTYGRARKGNTETLRQACEAAGIGLGLVDPVTVAGVVVSSTRIREFVAEGRVDAAAALLGRPFDLEGEVTRGMGRGRGIGFPTANVQTENEVRPAFGVYAVRGFTEDGKVYGGAANIGRKPTFGESEVTIEVHLFDFEGDLYGRRLAVEFIERLRGEQRFGSVEELIAQIARDCDTARAILQRIPAPGPLAPRPGRRAATPA